MKLSLDPSVAPPRHVTAESVALAAWYDAHPTVRRLWGIRDRHMLGVIVTLEPTVDNNDTYPTWFACSRGWSQEIQRITGSVVKLELIEEPLVEEFDVDIEGDIIAALNWRDPTYFWKAD